MLRHCRSVTLTVDFIKYATSEIRRARPTPNLILLIFFFDHFSLTICVLDTMIFSKTLVTIFVLFSVCAFDCCRNETRPFPVIEHCCIRWFLCERTRLRQCRFQLNRVAIFSRAVATIGTSLLGFWIGWACALLRSVERKEEQCPLLLVRSEAKLNALNATTSHRAWMNCLSSFTP